MITRDGSLPLEVVGIGAATWDQFWVVEEFSSDERVVEARAQAGMGGGPVATALCVLARLGHPCRLLDVCGDDPAGSLILQGLAMERVDTAGMQVVFGARSAEAVILVRARDGARQIVYRPSTAGEPCLGAAEKAWIQQARLLHLNGRHEEVARQAVAVAQGSGAAISFDGGAGRWRESLRDLVSASHIRIVALDFARRYAGTDDLEVMMRRLLEPPARLVVITDGVRGSHLGLPDGTRFHQPAFPVPAVVDTTGCGDVFHGAFLHGWLSGWEPARCSAFASRLAAANAAGLGGRHSLNGFLEGAPEPALNSCSCSGPR